MKTFNQQLKTLGLLLLVATGLTLGSNAYALGTPAGTIINNSADVDFDVSGVAQTTITSATADFTVDRLLDFTLVEEGGANNDLANPTVVPGQQDAVLRFTLTNTGNDTQDFLLSAANNVTTTSGPHGGADNQDSDGNFRFFINDGDDLFEPGGDDGAAITAVDDLVSTTGLNSVEIWVEDDIPLGAVNGNLIVITLTAEVATTAGVAIDTDDSGAANVEDGAAENIFSTALSSTSGDLTADDAYDIDSAVISIGKTLVVISDPVNGTTNPHAIPGAVMEYRIQVANGGALAADSVVITDD
ncbi:MAG: hypothetical protein MJA83_07355, partial [Gammaproteobacteria bacterium]|nr:hypothetical protein [Gammaproteobacteria bacterium]